AYATTCFGAQGLTTDEALVWVDAGLDRHRAFVAASRAREITRLFVDRVSLDAAVLAYATTCFGAQGLTTDEALVWVDAGLDRHRAFVA
ncbi:hypothetical protein CTI14_65320, partial [Methylobacterium radiotolerans]